MKGDFKTILYLYCTVFWKELTLYVIFEGDFETQKKLTGIAIFSPKLIGHDQRLIGHDRRLFGDDRKLFGHDRILF